MNKQTIAIRAITRAASLQWILNGLLKESYAGNADQVTMGHIFKLLITINALQAVYLRNCITSSL